MSGVAFRERAHLRFLVRARGCRRRVTAELPGVQRLGGEGPWRPPTGAHPPEPRAAPGGYKPHFRASERAFIQLSFSEVICQSLGLELGACFL